MNWKIPIVSAILLRVIYALTTAQHLFFNFFVDSAYYQLWALSILNGKPYLPPFFMSPLYPYFIALLYGIFPSTISPFALWLIQAAFDTVIVLLIYKIGTMVFRKEIGFIGALIYAFYPIAIFYSGLTLMACILTMLTTLVIFFFLLAIKKQNPQYLLFSGIFLGIGTIGRGNIVLIALVLVVYILVKPKESLPYLYHFIGGVLIPILILTVINITAGGEFIMTTYNLGINLYIGNNPDADGTYQNPGGLHLSTDIDARKTISALADRRVKKAESSRYWVSQAIEYIKTHPKRTVNLTAKKLCLFWGPREIHQVENFYYAAKRSFLDYIPIGFWLLAALYFSSLLLIRKKFMLLLISVPLTYSISFLPFFIIGRYRHPIAPVIIICAAASIYYAYNELRRKKYRLSIVATVLIILYGMVALLQQKSIRKSILKTKTYHAQFLRQKKMYRAAADTLNSILKEDPQFVNAWLELGIIYAYNYNLSAARDIFIRALKVDPNNPRAMLDLGSSYLGMGMLDSAIYYLEKGRERLPYYLNADYMIWQAKELKKLKETNEDSFNKIMQRFQVQ